jgi:hypothetical protein
MKSSRLVALVIISLSLLQRGFGQGFVNLDFEDATITPTPVGGFTYPADPTEAFPGWIVPPNSSSVYPTVVGYNSISLGAPAVSLMGPNFPNSADYFPLQGSYSVLLQYYGISGPPSLSQTGLVPANAQSISFLVPSGQNGIYSTTTVVTLNGVNIPLMPIAGGRVGGNVSAFAGNLAQLTFSTINSNDSIYFDDIQFSSSPVPEPSTLSLFGVCILFLCWLTPRPNQSPEPTPMRAVSPPSRLTSLAAWLSFGR